MTSTTDHLREQPIRKVFFKYFIPSTLGLLLLSINIVIDGIFIGHAVGENGLAAVNIAVPVFSFFYGIAFWIGIGGGTLYSIHIGKNEVKQARRIFTLAITSATILTIIISTFSIIFMKEMAYFFGANDVVIAYVLDYMFVILLFGIVFVLQAMLSIFIRNDGNPLLSMTALIVSAVTNIIFNYVFLFIFGWGVKGAAYGLILATALAFLVMLPHFFRKKSTLAFVAIRFEKGILQRIVTTGFPSFISEISVAIVALLYNVSFMKLVGEVGVASYSIVNYLHTMVVLMFIGVSSAIQPLVSFYYGAKLYEKMYQSLKLAVQMALIIGISVFIGGMLFASPLTKLFNAMESPLYEMTVQGIYLFFIHYLFLGVNLVHATFYQSIGKVKLSLIITVTRSIVLVMIFIMILPFFFGVKGVWLTVPVAECLTVLLVYYIYKRNIHVTPRGYISKKSSV